MRTSNGPDARGAVLHDDGEDSPLVVAFGPGGAGVSFWRSLNAHVPTAQTPLMVVRWPGRESRLAEPCLRSVEELAVDSYETLRATAHKRPLRFVGICLGGVVAHETSKLLRSDGADIERSISVDPLSRPPISDGTGNEALELRLWAQKAGIFPPWVLNNVELLDMCLAVLEADAAAHLQYDSGQFTPYTALGELALSPRTGAHTEDGFLGVRDLELRTATDKARLGLALVSQPDPSFDQLTKSYEISTSLARLHGLQAT